MSPRLVQVLVATAALGIAAPAAALLAFGDTTPAQFAYRSEGRIEKAARAVARSAATEPAPILLDETVIVAERPRARRASAAVAAPVVGCGVWRPTEAGPHARAAAASEVRSCDVLGVVVERAPSATAVAPRVPHPTMVFDYAIDAPN